MTQFRHKLTLSIPILPLLPERWQEPLLAKVQCMSIVEESRFERPIGIRADDPLLDVLRLP